MYKFLGATTAFIISMFWSAFWSGLTLSILWGWFMASIFGLPLLTVAQAFGVALCVKAASGLHKSGQKSEKTIGEQIAESMVLAPIVAGLVLLAGYIAKAFI